MDDKPICCDLYSGLGGWAEGFISEGYHCRGFDIEAHDYGSGGYPGELIIRDVRSIHGSECKDAAVIVASPPCQEPSYRAMPWKRARALSPEEVGIPDPEWWDKPESKMSHVELLSWRVWQRDYPRPDPKLFIELFNSCFRIQREAIEAAGHYIPLVIENVRGAQKWVGRARANYGSYYLWGDVGVVGNRIIAGIPKFGISVSAMKAVKVPGFRFDGDGGSFQTAAVESMGKKANPDGTDNPPGSWFKIADSKNRGTKTSGRSLSYDAENKWGTHNMGPGEVMHAEIAANQDGRKGPGGDWFKDGRQGQDACAEGLKNNGGSWFAIGGPGQTVTGQNPDGRKVPGISLSEGKSVGFNVTAAQRYRDGIKHGGDCFSDPNWPGKQGGTKQSGISGVRENGKGDKWFQDGAAAHGSRSDSRKAASAMIAKIPFALAQYIARTFKPIPVDSTSR
jgi:hypothetical protein